MDLLLNAFAFNKDNKRTLTLVLHGKDSRDKKSEVQTMVNLLGLNKIVNVYGPVYGDDKYEFLSAAKVYVHPSRWECHSIALLEALSMGIPTVVSSRMHIAPTLMKNSASVVVDPYNPENLFLAIEEAISNSDRLSENAKKCILSEFCWPEVVSNFLTRLDELLYAN